ncbi:MAG: EAL domain-containing protein [Acidobacteriota bacterium]|nr:MAG: EAL domain-containing protein [Acidobacteriota bacterium]
MVPSEADAFWISDLEGNLRYVSPGTAAAAGFEVEELLGKRLSSFLEPAAESETQAVMAQVIALRKPSGQWETQLIGRDGGRVPVLFSLEPLCLGSEILGILGRAAFVSPPREVDRSSIVPDLRNRMDVVLRESKRLRGRLGLLDRYLLSGSGLSTLFQRIPALVASVDASNRLRLANAEFARWFPAARYEKRHMKEVLGPDVYPLAAKAFEQALARTPVSLELAVTLEEAQTRWLSLTLIPEVGTSDVVSGFYFFGRDVTDQRVSSLSKNDALLRAEYFDQLVQKIDMSRTPSEILTDALDVLARQFPDIAVSHLTLESDLHANVVRSLGPEEEIPKEGLDIDFGRVPGFVAELEKGDPLVIEDVASVQFTASLADELMRHRITALVAMAVNKMEGLLEFFLFSTNDPRAWSYHEVKVLDRACRHIGPLMHSRRRLGSLLEEAQAKASAATSDPLTGLPNRLALDERLKQVLATAKREETQFALLYLDLDDFKQVNDTFGHLTGDQLLQEVAGRLKGCVRESDTVARVGGDEFIVLLPDIGDAGFTGPIAEKVLTTLRRPFQLDNLTLDVTVSAGVSVFPEDGRDTVQLIERADQAMLGVKKGVKGSFAHWTERIGEAARNRVRMANRIREGFAKDEFFLLYQPMVDWGTRLTIGVESLIRWRIDGKPALLPERFIPAVEELGLETEMLKWVIGSACKQARHWKTDGTLQWPITINLGKAELFRTDLLTIVSQNLTENDLAPDSLILEITELTLMQEDAGDVLNDLADHGVQFLLDDFGTGYSSISQLAEAPIQSVKLSRNIVSGLPSDERRKTIARATMEIARHLGLDLIAKGVETTEQLVYLTENGCTRFQGYFFSNPVPGHLIHAVL